MGPDETNNINPEQKKEKKKLTKKSAPQVTHAITNDQIADLIKDALAVQFKKQQQRVKTEAELEAMVATCEEFMKSFIILGYDFDGNAIEPIVIAHSQQEADSLGAYLNKFISSQIQRQG